MGAYLLCLGRLHIVLYVENMCEAAGHRLDVGVGVRVRVYVCANTRAYGDPRPVD